jgi:hypothetical protein
MHVGFIKHFATERIINAEYVSVILIKIRSNTGFEVCMMAIVQIMIFLVLASCLVDVYQSLGGIWCLHLQGRRVYSEESVRLCRRL